MTTPRSIGTAAVFLLFLAAAGPPARVAAARTLEPAPLVPGQAIDRLTRAMTRAEIGRDLFGDPAGTALFGQVEIFDRYPYVRARYVELATDAAWHRIVFGEPGAPIHAWDGGASALGPLRAPAGIDRDPRGRVFVADSGNDRVVVLDLRGDGADLRLEPRFAVGGLRRPSGVAWDGGATPLDPSDDRLWVADTGNHRVACFALAADGAALECSFGARGNGTGEFLEPRDVEVGHTDGVQSSDIYVADWGNGRIVKLEKKKGAGPVTWAACLPLGPGVGSVATDAWGNVYVGLREAGKIAKLDRDLAPLVESGADFPGIRDLAAGFLTVTDHRRGTRAFTGYASLVALEAWGESSGARRLELGVEVLDLARGAGGEIEFLLTDHAEVEVDVVAAGRAVRSESLGRLASGRRSWAWDGSDERGARVEGAVRFEVRARSLYEGGSMAVAALGGGAPAAAPALEPAWPNPAHPATQLQFFVPEGAADVRLDIVDVSGRLRRRLVEGRAAAGAQLIAWDGRDATGVPVPSGAYVVTLRVDGRTAASRKLTVLR